MGRSATVPSQDDLKSLAKPVIFSSDTLNRTYTIYARNGKMYHEESEREANGRLVFSETHEIAYTVGASEVGKSYLVAKGDAFFVSPISFYTRISGWDLSPGYDRSLFRGFARPVVELCVDCHTGQPRFVSGRPDHFLQPAFRFLSISCERCHGPGAIHVQQRKAGAPLKGPIDYSIVNPATMPTEVRDDICAQCHFLGDARVLRPGKNYLDFRPGTPLDKTVAIFSVPAKVKANRLFALSQFEQLKLSQCAIASKGRLGCITCHDPHVELRSGCRTELRRALQRATDLGSKSPEVRTKLADLRLRQEQVAAAIDLYKQSIQIEPFYTPAYLDLAHAYLISEDPKNAREILGRVLKFARETRPPARRSNSRLLLMTSSRS